MDPKIIAILRWHFSLTGPLKNELVVVHSWQHFHYVAVKWCPLQRAFKTNERQDQKPQINIYMWLVTRKGTSWVSYSEIHFFRFLNREFYDESKNINMLVGSWSFWVSKCPKKMGTALRRHKLSIDVIITLHVHHKIQQINTSFKILQTGVTMYLL